MEPKRGGRGRGLLNRPAPLQGVPPAAISGGADIQATPLIQPAHVSSDPAIQRVAAISPVKANDSPSSVSSGGRGAVLAKLKSAASSSSGDPVPGGRGSFLAKFRSYTASSNSGDSNQLMRSSVASAPKTDLSEEMSRVSLSSESTSLPIVPVVKMGTVGRRVNAMTNYVRIAVNPQKGVYQFDVKFSPTVDEIGTRFNLVRQHFPRRLGLRCYDGGGVLYLPEQLIKTKETFASKNPIDGSDVNVIITFVKHLKISECIHLLNIMFNNATKELKLTRLGTQYYNPRAAEIIPQHKLQVWPGYITSVEEKEDGVYLVCDTVHRVLRSETALNVIKTLCNGRDPNLKDLVFKELIGQPVITRYNNKIYKIDDVIWDKNPSTTFNFGDKEMSFVEYYKSRYGLQIEDLGQPLLASRPKLKEKGDAVRQMTKQDQGFALLIPELCSMTGITDAMRKDWRVMKDVAVCTKLTPHQRNARLKEYISSIKKNENAMAMFSEWGITVEDCATELSGRVLDTMKLRFGGQKTVEANADWGREVRRNTAFHSVDINRWVLIHGDRDQRRAESFAKMLQSVGPGLGITIRKPILACVRGSRTTDFINALETNSNVEIAVVILPQPRDDLYSAIKKKCLKELKIGTQVVISNTLAREDKMRPIVQNIALQMNVKLGGALWTIKMPFKNLMVCGIDTYHDNANRKSSCGAFVASLDSTYSYYYSKTANANTGQELIVSLAPCFVTACNRYYERNKVLPETVIVYRDGVGDGQLKTVKGVEVSELKKACSVIAPGYSPKIIFVVVQKRISTRIYENSGKGVVNASPGTVVDHQITKYNWHDFLIVSQLVGQGTASPTHYVVVHDDADVKVDDLQRLTFALCHLYYNWPGTVRVPAPCLYAHKLAGLIGESVKSAPADVFDELLYYL